MKQIAIIGAGLSGLYAAYLLKEHYALTLFEARDRLGGRIHSVDEFDLGPSWIWNHHHRILALTQKMGLELFYQYESGLALYETPEKIEAFRPSPVPPPKRLKGGIKKLIDALAATLEPFTIHLNETVETLRDTGDQIELTTPRGTYRFDHIISALPPRLAAQNILYNPPLPEETYRKFSAIPTWMGHTAKCVIEFKEPFWRHLGLSGFCFSHAGPMGEIHDACTENHFALFGFINAHADMEHIEENCRKQMIRLFGDRGKEILSFHCVDWREERYTAASADKEPRSTHPHYGTEALHFGGKIHFIGTETSYDEGGYLEGAIASCDRLKEIFNV